MKVMIEKDN